MVVNVQRGSRAQIADSIESKLDPRCAVIQHLSAPLAQPVRFNDDPPAQRCTVLGGRKPAGLIIGILEGKAIEAGEAGCIDLTRRVHAKPMTLAALPELRVLSICGVREDTNLRGNAWVDGN